MTNADWSSETPEIVLGLPGRCSGAYLISTLSFPPAIHLTWCLSLDGRTALVLVIHI